MSKSQDIKKISKAPTDAGVRNNFIDEISIPIEFVKAMQVEEQAKFNPVRYVYRLAEEFEKAGGSIVQQCRVIATDERRECGN